MTLREKLQRQVRLHLLFIFGSWLLIPLAAFVFKPQHRSSPLLLLPLLVFAGVTFSFTFRLVCPRCGGRLGALAGYLAGLGFRRVNFCPFCGLNLDQTAT